MKVTKNLLTKLINEQIQASEYCTPDGLKNLVNSIAMQFRYDKGVYSENKSYAYGSDIKWKDKTTEKGYINTFYDLKIEGKNLLLKNLKFNSDVNKAIKCLFGKNFDKGFDDFDRMSFSGRYATGITSKKSELIDITIFAGGDVYNRYGSLLYAKINYIDYPNVSGWFNKLKSQLQKTAKEATVERVVTQIFDDFSSKYLFKVLSKSETKEDARHIGYGSQASTHVSTKIYKKYDFRMFVKYFGIEMLRKCLMATYFGKKNVREISDDGLVSTDESWTMVYD